MPNYYTLFSEELTELVEQEITWLKIALTDMEEDQFEAWKEQVFPD